MLYRFQIELSDVDRGVYESLDFRVAQHPSETFPYMLSRILAYCLNYQEGLEFSAGGLSDPEAPALRKLGNQNSVELWIEVGNPSARKLHKASKNADLVKVYTYKSAEVLLNEIRSQDIHKADKIFIGSFDPKFLEKLSGLITKNNKWSLLVQQDLLTLSTGADEHSTELKLHKL